MHFTAEERHLLQMLAAGYTNTAAADETGVCTRTIESRRQVLMKKLDARTPVQLGYKYGKWLQQYTPSPEVVEGDGAGDGGATVRL